MRTDYLIAGVILIALGFVQLWANGRWPFRPHEPDEGEEEGGPEQSPVREGGRAETAPAGRGLWGSWTNVAGYVAIALGVVAVVLAALRA
ncbi:MAG: hypothetical protein GX536_07470 [Actinobacteria bacterium]|nr:hypothetical protein [Actinomycetota bacterium]